MLKHQHKREFNVISVTVMVFEVLAFSVFLFGVMGAIANMFVSPPILTLWGFLILVLGGTTIAFFLLAIAEFLQLLLKIEYNTRKTEQILEGRKTEISTTKPILKKGGKR